MALGKKWRRYRGWIALGALVVVAGTVYGVSRMGQKPTAATTYETTAASTGTLSVTVSGTGNLAVLDSVDVYPKVSGTIADLRVAEGSKVKEGQILFTLDEASTEQATAKALASLRQASQGVSQGEANVLDAQNSLKDLQNRADEPSSTVTSAQISAAKKRVTAAKSGLSASNASYTSAKLSYNQAVDDENSLTVKAPCDGIVWSLNTAEGDSVSSGSGGGSSSSSSGSSSSGSAGAGTSSGTSASSSSSNAPIVIARDGELAVQLAVNEVDVSSLKKGQAAEIAFDAVPDLIITGQVHSVGTKGTVSSGVVTYDVWVTLDVSDKRLKDGMSAAADMVTAVQRNAILVPNGAIKTDTQKGDYVQVMDAGAKTPRQVPVKIGLQNATQTVIEGGLKSGQLVVTQTVSASDSTSSPTSSGSGDRGGGFMGGGPGGF